MIKAQDTIAVDCQLYYYDKDKLYLYFDRDGYANGELWTVDIDALSNHTYQSILAADKVPGDNIRLDVIALIDRRTERLIAVAPVV